MSQPDALGLWCEHRRVGTLWRNPVGLMGFRYHPEWLETGFAISRSLPMENSEFPPEAATAHRFFANLLREGGVRDLKLPDSDFELLRASGGECVGAPSIFPSPPLNRSPSNRTALGLFYAGFNPARPRRNPYNRDRCYRRIRYVGAGIAVFIDCGEYDSPGIC